MGRTNSAVIVARLLESEGFSDHTANQILRYSRRITAPQTQARYERTARAAKDRLREMDEGTKMLVGKFMNHQMRIAFDCGLRIGLTAHAVMNAKEVETIGHNHECRTQQKLENTTKKKTATKETNRQSRASATIAAETASETGPSENPESIVNAKQEEP